MIELNELRFQYPKSDFELALSSTRFETGEKVAVVGPSGCGKTTLLNLISGITLPRSGSVVVNGQTVSSMNDARRRNFRIANIGFVFQQFELVDYLDLKTNILLPFLINRSLQRTRAIEKQAVELAEEMGLGGKLRRRPGQLSQGEKQRVAVCRALITRPKILLADEPTGNLDPSNKRGILEILNRQVEQNQQTLIVVTHDHGILDLMDRTMDFAVAQTPPALKGK